MAYFLKMKAIPKYKKIYKMRQLARLVLITMHTHNRRNIVHHPKNIQNRIFKFIVSQRQYAIVHVKWHYVCYLTSPNDTFSFPNKVIRISVQNHSKLLENDLKSIKNTHFHFRFLFCGSL